MVRRVDGRQVVELGDRRIISMVREAVEVDRILAAEERAGIAHVVLSPWVPLERHPNLKVLLAHAGGGIPALAGAVPPRSRGGSR